MTFSVLRPRHIFCLLALLALPARSAPDLGTSEFKDLKADYERIHSAYPEKREKLLGKMLDDYLKSSRARYKQEKSAANLKGMGVAKVAVRELEQARAQVAEKGDFKIGENIHPALQEFFEQVEKSRKELLDNIEKRRETLRRRTFARFASLYRKAEPEAVDETIIADFEDWIKSSKEDGDKDAEEEQAEEEAARISASDLGLNLFSKKYGELKNVFSRNISKLAGLRKKGLDKILGAEIEKAEDWYAEQKRLRNIKGMAVSGKAVSILEQTRSELAEKGEISLPEKQEQREEIRTFLAGLEERMAEEMKPYSEKQAFLEAEGLKRFKQIANEQVPGIDAANLETIYQDWLADKYKQEQPSQAAAAGGASKPSPSGGGTADRLYFAQTGSADKWFAVGSWMAETKSMDIFSIPIYAGRDKRGTQTNIQTGLPSRWNYDHESDLEKRCFYAFRLKKIKGCQTVDVVGWPNERNEWVLEVRTGLRPGTHGFEIEAGRTVGAGGRSQAAERFDIPVKTQPAGARVYVDGSRKYEPGTKSLTPMTIRLEGGSYEIVLKKDDHLDKVIKDFRAGSGARISTELKHESELQGQQLTFAAGKGWKRTKIEVEIGDKIWVIAEGNWTAGTKGEAIGPAGYSRSEYPHYRAGGDLRKFKGANYGALLMKVGEKYYGAPAELENKRAVAVNRRVGITADTWGELWFDVNEMESRDLRRNNRGALKLKVIVIPDGKLPSG